MRTIQALREAVYSALTVPQLQYRINTDTAPLIALPIANVFSKPVWDLGQNPPMPALAFSVAVTGNISRLLPDRRMALKLWAISAKNGDECSEIYEAARARLHTADQDRPPGIADLSRVASGTTLQLVLRELIEVRVSEPSFETSSSRYYLSAEYNAIAL